MAALRAIGAGEGVAGWPLGWEARWDHNCDVLLVVGPGGQNFRITREKLEQAGSIEAVRALLLVQPEQFLHQTAEWLRGVPAKGLKVGVDATLKGRILDL